MNDMIANAMGSLMPYILTHPWSWVLAIWLSCTTFIVLLERYVPGARIIEGEKDSAGIAAYAILLIFSPICVLMIVGLFFRCFFEFLGRVLTKKEALEQPEKPSAKYATIDGVAGKFSSLTSEHCKESEDVFRDLLLKTFAEANHESQPYMAKLDKIVPIVNFESRGNPNLSDGVFVDASDTYMDDDDLIDRTVIGASRLMIEYYALTSSLNLLRLEDRKDAEVVVEALKKRLFSYIRSGEYYWGGLCCPPMASRNSRRLKSITEYLGANGQSSPRLTPYAQPMATFLQRLGIPQVSQEQMAHTMTDYAIQLGLLWENWLKEERVKLSELK